MQEQQVDEEFNAAWAWYLARREAGRFATCRIRKRGAAWAYAIGAAALGGIVASSPMSRSRRSRSLTDRRICPGAGRYRLFYMIDEERRAAQIDHVAAAAQGPAALSRSFCGCLG
jgi:hypothetical protein